MGKANRPKTDNLAWIKALLFPKKGKPIASVKPAKFETPPDETLSAATQPVVITPATSPAQQPASPPAAQPPRVTLKNPATSSTSGPAAVPASAPPANIPAAAPATPTADSSSASKAAPETKRPYLPTLWTVTSVISMVVNVILIIVLLVAVRELFTLKALVGDQLLGGLYNNFVLMDEAHIRTTIEVQADVPIEFTLPVQTNTIVQLTEDTRIDGARVTLSTGGLNIVSAPTNIILPAGTNLPIALDITVPVNTTIPITLQVPVDIPLEETELHEPFVGLQEVVGPYYYMLFPEIKGPQDIAFCRAVPWFCMIIFRSE